MIKAVVFDWGGVIAPNAHDGWLNVLADMLDTTVEKLLPHWRAAGYKEFSAGLIDETTFWLQFEKSLGKPLPDDKAKIWIEGGALQPWPEILELIKDLRRDGIVTAVLSNTVEPLSAVLRKKGHYRGFDEIVLSDEVGLAKPDPTIYKLVLDKLNLKAVECIYIDDLPKNLMPAEGMGMTTILASDDPKKTVLDIKIALWR